MLAEAYICSIRPEVIATAHALVALTASGHAVLTKEEPRSAVGWVGLIWLTPFLGSLLYYIFGINRIRRKAVAIMGREGITGFNGSEQMVSAFIAEQGVASLGLLATIGDRVTGLPLLPGNAVSPLVNGDEAYPAMLEAIRQARTSVMLSTYIFDNDPAGREFVEALGAAVKRGVDVRVLIDATGARYSFPTIVGKLRAAGVRTARFMPNFSIRRMSAFNLRSHRKILVVDGRIGFTGGMNIRQGHIIGCDGCAELRGATQDLHFRVEGPVVAHLRQAFVEDWVFTTKETLAGDKWLPPLHGAGNIMARGVLDGPDSDFEKTLWTMLGAISAARSRIRIMTPYFLPDATMTRFLDVAAMAGVDIEIFLPERNNIILVQWAMMTVLPSLLSKGCRVYLTPPPFDHSKMMLVDDVWALIGSANWDARSLRLNFEFNIECYSQDLGERLNAVLAKKRRAARQLTLADVNGRHLPVRLRDGLVRLMTPYL